jgi:exopolyphosphatase/guanosine-5'-triphosphate,3'-diphosphate pyrophosphatase
MSQKILNNLPCLTPNAVIDIGTSTLRLQIGCVKNGKVHRILNKRIITQLGKDLKGTNEISQVNIDKTISYLSEFKELCEEYKVKKIVAVGTSILRDAKNSGELIEKTQKKLNIQIYILSGEEEADFTLKGVLNGLPSTISHPFFITDIGGGSTEWILCDKYTVKRGSIDIGAVRLYEMFIRSDPPSTDELKMVHNYVSKKISEENLRFKSTINSFISTGGTATTLASIDLRLDQYDSDRIHLHQISIQSINKIYNLMVKNPLKERIKIQGLESDRADIIIAGVLILLEIMKTINSNSVIISDYGLLEGLLLTL